MLAFKQASLQEYHKGILNMHLHLLLMRYESVRLLMYAATMSHYNSRESVEKLAVNSEEKEIQLKFLKTFTWIL